MARVRLRKDERREQLIAVSWSIVRERGCDALTLGHLAEEAGVAKPVVYSHFASRSALLVALYGEFDDRQALRLDQASAEAEPTLAGHARAVADSYVGCVIASGRELVGVLAALEGSPDLEEFKRESEAAYVDKCRGLLDPFSKAGQVSQASMAAIFGAAESLSRAAASESLTADEAVDELTDLIVGVVGR